MIDSLNGEVLDKGVDHVVMECHGVGYLVHVPASVVARIPSTGRFRLHTHYTVTVDVRSGSSDHRLYGFADTMERQLFRQLIDVQGVSSTIGIAILGARTAQEVQTAIIQGDEAMLKGIKGIGPKLALRIITDLQGRLVPGAVSSGGAFGTPGNSLKSEALSALVSLGLDRIKAERGLQAVLKDHGSEEPPLEELIRLTLKKI